MPNTGGFGREPLRFVMSNESIVGSNWLQHIVCPTIEGDNCVSPLLTLR